MEKKSALALALAFAATGLFATAHAESEQRVVVLDTSSGEVVIELFPGDAPNHVENFLKLAGEGFYDGTVFHRIIPGFMIQGGDPLTRQGAYQTTAEWGTGDPGHTVAQEFNDIKHVRGIVSMARSHDPDSAGSQFFIVHADSSHLDGQYTAFGRIATQESFETLDQIASLQTVGTVPENRGGAEIISAAVKPRSEVPNLIESGDPARMTAGIGLATGQPHRNDRLGIEFHAPAGWLVQEPQKSSPQVPDVVAVTTGPTDVNPSISVTVVPADGQGLDEKIDERRKTLQPAIDSGVLNLTAVKKTDTYEHGEAYLMEAEGRFDGEDGGVMNVRFKEILFLENDKFYAITYTNEASVFDQHVDKFEAAVEMFSIMGGDTGGGLDADPAPETGTDGSAPDPAPETGTDGGGGGGCLVATAAYGSELAPQVQLLRELRDSTVLQTESGSAFMAGFGKLYYAFSPTVADWERQNPAFRDAVRAAIAPMLGTLAILSHAGVDSEHEMVGYGAAVIAANVGMYIAAPAIVIRTALGKLLTRHRPHRQDPCTPSPAPAA